MSKPWSRAHIWLSTTLIVEILRIVYFNMLIRLASFKYEPYSYHHSIKRKKNYSKRISTVTSNSLS